MAAPVLSLKNIYDLMDQNQLFCWDLSYRAGYEMRAVADYYRDKADLAPDQSKAQLKAMVEQFPPGTPFQVTLQPRAKATSSERRGPFDFVLEDPNPQSMQGLGNIQQMPPAMPSWMTSLGGLMPATFMDERMKISEERTRFMIEQAAFQAEKKAWEERLKEREAQMKELEQEYTSRTSSTQKALEKTLYKLVDSWGDNKPAGLEGAKAAVAENASQQEEPLTPEMEKIQQVAEKVHTSGMGIQWLQIWETATDTIVAKHQEAVANQKGGENES